MCMDTSHSFDNIHDYYMVFILVLQINCYEFFLINQYFLNLCILLPGIHDFVDFLNWDHVNRTLNFRACD
jgi:hypothetical protein